MATKYVSALTGQEMDAALQDMAYHTSEAYAVGTRNGVAVGSSDVTYHNNSKYWAEQVYGYTDRAEDAANRAESAVPAGTAGAVFFDRVQSLTDAQKSQARANIMAGGSNRNLLDNSWFTVNQRAFTSQDFGSSGNGYTVDRWKAFRSIVTVESDGSLSVTPNTGDYGIAQYFDASVLTIGETYTASVNIGGTIYSWTFEYSASAIYSPRNANGSRFYRHTAGGICDIWLIGTAGTTYNLRAFKLEKGSVSTLANDAPPDYGTELAKCQRYFLRIMSYGTHSPIAFGYGSNATTCRMLIPTPVTMRALPTVTMTGSYLLFGYGSNFAVTSLGAIFTRANGVAILASAASGIAGSQAYCLVGNQTDDYIDLSADL